jgi:peptide/nickel transport system permease protein
MGGLILTESTLSFLGLGIQPPTASWGNLLQSAQSLTIMTKAPWYPFIPGFMIFLTIMCFNFIGDGLRSAFDSR